MIDQATVNAMEKALVALEEIAGCCGDLSESRRVSVAARVAALQEAFTEVCRANAIPAGSAVAAVRDELQQALREAMAQLRESLAG